MVRGALSGVPLVMPPGRDILAGESGRKPPPKLSTSSFQRLASPSTSANLPLPLRSLIVNSRSLTLTW